jgi:Mg2+/Co2+ transporter CorB
LDHLHIAVFLLMLVLLIVLAAFFSAAETALMAINRYRLRHKAKLKRGFAVLALRLLKRPDRLLGVILIGNNFSNILASALVTLLAVRFWGEQGAILASIGLTFFILIFAEVAPKTLAAVYPEQISRLVSWPIYILLKLLYPLVWLVNGISNGLLRLLYVKVNELTVEPLSREELRTVVFETSGRISRDYQDMLLGILDLNKLTVKDVMVLKENIVGVDLDWSWDKIQKYLSTSEYDWLPVYRENINQIIGVLHLRELTHKSIMNVIMDKDIISKILHEPYFVPEGTPLNIQLMNFQRQRKRFAFVVDEYGEVLGLVTLVDILEEIVGEFTTTMASTSKLLETQTDGSYLVDGAITIRELNRLTKMHLPTRGARTLNGLVTNYLEMIPRPGICLKVEHFPIEIIDVKDNRVKVARIFPKDLKNA